ncbi:MAG: ATP-binding cassette domain-containing protein, partial [Candidatus Merdisoma sp.]
LPVFYEHLSGCENLKLHCEYMGYYRHGSIEEALELLDLTATRKKPVRSYSLGMKERLGIARAVLCRPELLILDEPTNGLDPAGMKQIRDLLQALCSKYGTTIMISSHILSEIESIADTIGVISHGTMQKEISMNEIESTSLAYIEVTVANPQRAAYVLSEKLGLTNFRLNGDTCFRIYDSQISTQELSKALALNDVEILSLGRRNETLEDYFLKITAEVKDHVKAD